MQKQKKLLFYFILILIPVLFFVLFEITLRALDYGYNTDVFTEVKPGWLEVNPDLARKYFHNVKKTPSTNKDVFRKVKPQNGFRVFVLGGSSGAGYPYIPLAAFSRYLRTRLELAYPSKTIEVVNMSMTAINSYSLRDMTDAVLEQKPDLILIYAGHNEYYGALGVGSMENLGTSVPLVNFVLSLEKFKVFQFTRNLIRSIVSSFGGKEKPKTGTLMSRMAEKKKIPFRSELYKKGIEQFEENLSAILSKAKEVNVPVIISTLACNLFDMPPFISEQYENYPPAKKVYASAHKIYKNGELKKADSLFVLAKDLDMLRFRAPSEINLTIKKLAKKFNFPLADSYAALKNASKNKIIGDDLMTDHLHPTLRGYQIIGKTFYETMASHHLLPKGKPAISFGFQHKLTLANYNFTALDSVTGAIKIKLLKNDWPFINPKNKLPLEKLFKPKNYVDSLAWKFALGDIDWIDAHTKLADYYFNRKQYEKYYKTMRTIVSQFPIVPRFYENAATKLISVNRLDYARKILTRQMKIIPNAFATKWLGIIYLKMGNSKLAGKYLKQSIEYYNRDAQVYYNLAGALIGTKNYVEALSYVNKALQIQPNYKQAKNLKLQLESVVKRMRKN